MPRNVIVVGPAARVRQEQAAAVRQPVRLCVVTSQVRAIVEGPRPGCAELLSVVTCGDIGSRVVAESQVILPLEFRD